MLNLPLIVSRTPVALGLSRLSRFMERTPVALGLSRLSRFSSFSPSRIAVV
jgi:hypothetical protein